MSDREDGAGPDGPSGSASEGASSVRPTDESSTAENPSGVGGWVRWFLTTDSGVAVYARDVLTSVGAVLLIGLVLFAISGIWPPMVAVESTSMNPNMERGDLVFVVDNERFVPEGAVLHDGTTTGVVPADIAADRGHTEFGRAGDVIIFMPNGNPRRTPVIHRAMLFVQEGENWYDRADSGAIGNADNCRELNNCPAPHSGFITQGDNEVTNTRYDQVSGLSTPVRPAWIIGTAEVKIPYLGHIRLSFSGQVAPPLEPTTAGASTSPTPTPTVPHAGTAHPVA